MRNGLLFFALLSGILGCDSQGITDKTKTTSPKNTPVHIVSAMKNVMWKGELGAKIKLDTLANKKGLYGLGPQEYLTGELLIVDGETYLSTVGADSTMQVAQTNKVGAPFFVYAKQTEWREVKLPANVKTVKDVERFVMKSVASQNTPFVFKLSGRVAQADIHIQNLPLGTQVSNPKQGHQGQVSYHLKDVDADIIGFFSKEHQGVFTRHDLFVHMHFLSKDKTAMGHLDALTIEDMVLYLPTG